MQRAACGCRGDGSRSETDGVESAAVGGTVGVGANQPCGTTIVIRVSVAFAG